MVLGFEEKMVLRPRELRVQGNVTSLINVFAPPHVRVGPWGMRTLGLVSRLPFLPTTSCGTGSSSGNIRITVPVNCRFSCHWWALWAAMRRLGPKNPHVNRGLGVPPNFSCMTTISSAAVTSGSPSASTYISQWSQTLLSQHSIHTTDGHDSLQINPSVLVYPRIQVVINHFHLACMLTHNLFL
jgi:hypothetical protein